MASRSRGVLQTGSSIPKISSMSISATSFLVEALLARGTESDLAEAEAAIGRLAGTHAALTVGG